MRWAERERSTELAPSAPTPAPAREPTNTRRLTEPFIRHHLFPHPACHSTNLYCSLGDVFRAVTSRRPRDRRPSSPPSARGRSARARPMRALLRDSGACDHRHPAGRLPRRPTREGRRSCVHRQIRIGAAVRSRAARTRSRTTTDGSPGSPSAMADTGTAGTSTMRSMRSRNGPEACLDTGQSVSVHRQPRCSSPRNPQDRDSSQQPARTGQGRRRFARHERSSRALPRGVDAAPRERAYRTPAFRRGRARRCARARSLPGADGAASNERDIRHGVMRRAKRPFTEQANARRQRAGDRVDGRALQRLVERERRKNRSQPPRHHRLARARRPFQ